MYRPWNSNEQNNIEFEWVSINSNLATFQLYHDDNKLIVNEAMPRSDLQ
jgi:hypothetical protein